MANDHEWFFSRRDVLKGAAVAGAALPIVPVDGRAAEVRAIGAG
jgi:hypothetical protein